GSTAGSTDGTAPAGGTMAGSTIMAAGVSAGTTVRLPAAGTATNTDRPSGIDLQTAAPERRPLGGSFVLPVPLIRQSAYGVVLRSESVSQPFAGSASIHWMISLASRSVVEGESASPA